jgi:hypothetical protein
LSAKRIVAFRAYPLFNLALKHKFLRESVANVAIISLYEEPFGGAWRSS